MASARFTSKSEQSRAGGPHLPLADANDVVADNGAAIANLEPIKDVAELELALSEPTDELIESLSQLQGDVMILGAGGKMGPSLARMTRRAFDAAGANRRVIAVSRFSKPRDQTNLQSLGVDVLRGDLLDANFVRSLPEVENVLYLVGMKFGSAAALAETWASNVYLAGVVADRLRASRIVALSTGNVYGLTAVQPGGGSAEGDLPAPVGEYAMSALGRERVFEHFSRQHQIPMAIIRLNYATELRYGVLVDLAQKVSAGAKVSLEMGYFNVIWQRDACEMILRSFECAATPPLILNVTGTERCSCRDVCERFGRLLGRDVQFTGAESPTALLSNAHRAVQLFGRPRTTIDQMTAWIADWMKRGGEMWDKPTRFEVRDGRF